MATYDRSLQCENGKVTVRLELMWLAPRLIAKPEFCRDSTIRNAFSLTCESMGTKPAIVAELVDVYMHNSWGEVGDVVLECFLLALHWVLTDDKGPSRTEKTLASSDAVMIFVATIDVLSVTATCPLLDWIAIRESILWLEQSVGCPSQGLAVRPPVAELRRSLKFSGLQMEPMETVLSYTSLRQEALDMMGNRDLPAVLVHCRKELPLDVRQDPLNFCWVKLVESAYIAWRQDHQVIHGGEGLRIRFELLVQLAAVERAIIHKGGIVLTGYSTALVPINRIQDQENSVQWHAILTGQSRRVKKQIVENFGHFNVIRHFTSFIRNVH